MCIWSGLIRVKKNLAGRTYNTGCENDLRLWRFELLCVNFKIPKMGVSIIMLQFVLGSNLVWWVKLPEICVFYFMLLIFLTDKHNLTLTVLLIVVLFFSPNHILFSNAGGQSSQIKSRRSRQALYQIQYQWRIMIVPTISTLHTDNLSFDLSTWKKKTGSVIQ